MFVFMQVYVEVKGQRSSHPPDSWSHHHHLERKTHPTFISLIKEVLTLLIFYTSETAFIHFIVIYYYHLSSFMRPFMFTALFVLFLWFTTNRKQKPDDVHRQLRSHDHREHSSCDQAQVWLLVQLSLEPGTWSLEPGSSGSVLVWLHWGGSD